MTKREVLDWYFSEETKELRKRLQNELENLMKGNRITTGCLLVYGPYNNYHHNWISKQLDKAGKSTNYLRSLKRQSNWDWNYHRKEFLNDMEKTRAFIDEQNALPFEQTQKQLLIASEELKVEE